MRVLVVAAGSMAQAGMAALVESVPGLEVAASVSPTSARDLGRQVEPDVCLVDLERAAEAEEILGMLVEALECPVVAITELDGFASALAAGATGVLTPAIPGPALGAALEAARAGVGVVYPPGALPISSAVNPAAPPLASGAAPKAPIEVLTARETEVLRLMADGLTNQQVARRLGISEHTAKFHVSAVLGKLDAQSRAEAVTQGYRLGLISV